jgi:hypothetical protein
MKKFGTVFILFLFLYCIYFDLKIGTLPQAKAEPPPAQAAYSEQPASQAYKEVQIQPGETMLTILERIHNGSIPVAIEQAVNDFEQLNDGVSAHSIKAGQTYRFPSYR